MVATVENLNARKSDRKGKPAPMLSTVSRLGDLQDDVTMEALRRAAEIRKTWSKAEVARRKQVGQKRFSELKNLLVFSN